MTIDTKGGQTISFTSFYAKGSTYIVSATATSQLPVTFSIDASTISLCTISDTTVTFLPAALNCTVDANQGGDSNWNAAPQVQQSIRYNSGVGGGGR